MLPASQPFRLFNDADGTPLEDGYLYFGTVNQNPETTPVAIYWDEAGTQPAAQPVRTSGGYPVRNGTPAVVYINSDFSITVRDKKQRIVFTAPSSKGIEWAFTGSGGSSLIGFIQVGANAVATTAQTKMRERKSFQDWMSDTLKTCVTTRVYTDQNRMDMYTALSNAWTSALTNGHDLYAPAGLYQVGEQNMPWRNTQYPTTTVLDAQNITIYGDGEATEFSTLSVGGADVFQLNGLKNFHARNLSITAALTGAMAGAGSNGISVTNGFDNITLMDIYVHDLPGLDKGAYIDGGKGLSLQAWPTNNPVGSLKARIHVKNCAEGFGFEPDLANAVAKAQSVDVEVIAERCFQAVKFSAGAATGAVPAGWSCGLRVRGQAINCQQDVILGRAHGVDIDMQIVTTMSVTERFLRPDGSGNPWFAANTVVEALICTYAKDSRVVLTGYKRDCAYKAQIGGGGAGSSGLSGSTQNCEIYLDLGGTASVSDLNWIDSGGNSVDNCILYFSNTTTASVAIDFYQPALGNVVINGPSFRLRNPLVSGLITLTGTDGKTASGKLGEVGGVPTVQQLYASGAQSPILDFLNQAGARKFAVRNDGAMMTDGRNTATAVATVKQAMPIYDSANALVGYVPIYTTYTP